MNVFTPRHNGFTPIIYITEMVKHVVVFKFTGTPEERLDVATRFREALLALPAQIPVLESMEAGINSNPSETWDLTLTAVVPAMADVDVYAKHPAHVAAAGIITGHTAGRACVDYEF